MIRINITTDSDLLQQLSRRMPGLFGAGVAPATQKAFTTSARYIKRVWQHWAMGEEFLGLSTIKHPSSKLGQSVKIRQLGPFIAEIYSESPYMKRIVDGSPQVDMKESYPYGRKSRVSKDGIPYLIIPFRWATPNEQGRKRAHFGNVIPQKMYDTIRAFKMEKSLRLNTTHDEPNYSGEPIERSEYNWGEKLDAEGNIDGLVSFKSETRGKGSTYFTFRIVSANSPAGSWIRRAVPPVDFENGLAKTVTPTVEEMIQFGLEADIGIGN